VCRGAAGAATRYAFYSSPRDYRRAHHVLTIFSYGQEGSGRREAGSWKGTGMTIDKKVKGDPSARNIASGGDSRRLKLFFFDSGDYPLKPSDRKPFQARSGGISREAGRLRFRILTLTAILLLDPYQFRTSRA